jgi:hypothetical protein
MAATANLRIDQGSTFSSDINLSDASGVAFDLTNYTAAAKMALGYSSTRTRVSFNTSISNDPTLGIVTIQLTATQTAALEAPARYVFDVEVTNTTDNSVIRAIEGIITVSPNVTI